MLFQNYLVAVTALATGALAKEKPVDKLLHDKLYVSGVRHMEIMSKKAATWAAQEQAGAFNSSQYELPEEVFEAQRLASRQSAAPLKTCVNGVAAVVAGNRLQTFRCSNIDLYDFKTHAQLGSSRGQGSSSWGWTAPNGREFVAIAQSDGAAFAEITSAGKLVYLGRLPQYSAVSIWRELRVYKNYLVVGSEAVGHNVQIFDLSKLLSVNPASPKTFSNSADLTGLFKGLPNGQTHNIVINEEKGYAVAVGAVPRTSACRSGLIFINLANPASPTTPGCAAQDGYVHDAQCLVYRGPQTKYVGRDICYGYNEDSLTIYDVTDKANTKVISKTSYTGAAYTHQGWVLDPQNQQFLIMDDEYDEYDKVQPAANGRPVTYIWDIRNLEAPKQTGYYKSTTSYSVDHNQYVVNGFSYQSNYGAGLRVLDVRSIPSDPTGKGVKEVAFFDVYPEDDNQTNGGVIDFVGTWSSYAFFKSGYILINTIERGAFVVKRTDL